MYFGKRAVDVMLSFLAIIIFLLPMVIVAILIKCDSKGPIIFKQQRIGKNKEPFNIYKFRTMRMGTPNVSTESLGDPSQYITRLGMFLRRSSLDELPQLFNILKGNMSIVGPRPALYNQYELIGMRDAHGVNKVPPGLTGYAQIKGRDFISDEGKVQYDCYYVENMSFWFDFRIIVWTIKSVLKADGVKIK